MKILLHTTNTVLFLLFIALTAFTDNCFSQISEEPLPTLESIQQKITTIQTKMQSIDYRLNSIPNDPDNSTQQQTIASIQTAKSDLEKELERLERIKTSIEYAEQNQLLEKKTSGTPHTYAPTQKTKIHQADFDALPEIKKEAVLAHPEQYEIIN